VRSEEERDIFENGDGGPGGVRECHVVHGKFPCAFVGHDLLEVGRAVGGSEHIPARKRCRSGGFNESDERRHGEFAFGENDELRDAHL